MQIAIGYDDNLMLCRGQHIDQIRDLAIRPVRRGIDDDGDITVRKANLNTAQDGQGRILGILDSEHNLEIRVCLRETRDQRLFEQRLVAAKRPQHGYRRTSQWRYALPARRESANDNDSQEALQHAQTSKQCEKIGNYRHRPANMLWGSVISLGIPLAIGRGLKVICATCYAYRH